MKITRINSLAIPEVQVITFSRFKDHRGYFTEPYRKSDVRKESKLASLKKAEFVQNNESFSFANTVRGLHFQWNPFMGKLVRTISGHMVDLVLDIRQGSPTWGKIIAYDMPTSTDSDHGEWIWIPPGFAHGNFFLEDSQIEYYCTGEYSPNCEAGISPFSSDLDWSLCDNKLKSLFESIAATSTFVSDKDRNALSLRQWAADGRSKEFVYPIAV